VSIRILIVDDEAVARQRLKRLLAAEPDVTIVGESPDGASALRAIALENPDMVFLDVQMPELDGFEVVQSIPPGDLPGIVFVTAFDRYALRAFDVHAIDYLLKPFTRERFRTALARARDRLKRRHGDSGLDVLVEQLRELRPYQKRVAIRIGDRFIIVPWHDVDWIEAADNYVKLHAGPREYLLRETLASIQKQLDPAMFARVHRSAVVQIDRIAEFHRATHGDVNLVLRSGVRLILTRTWRSRVERLVHDSGEAHHPR